MCGAWIIVMLDRPEGLHFLKGTNFKIFTLSDCSYAIPIGNKKFKEVFVNYYHMRHWNVITLDDFKWDGLEEHS